MYKKYIELKTGGRIRIKSIKTDDGNIGLQIFIYDKEGNILLKSNFVEHNKLLYIIKLLINENDIEDFVESDY